MASLFGPEEFIVNLLVLLVIMVVVILLFDRLLRRRGGMSLHGGRRGKGRPTGGSAIAAGRDKEETVGSSRLSRNYLGSGGSAGSEQERTFGLLYKEANDALNQEPGSPTTRALMKSIDDQFLRTLSYFVDGQDRSSSLHMEHNYLWLKYREKAQEEPNEAFTALTQSLAKLVERQGMRPYDPREFAQMMERYQGTMADLNRAKGFNVNAATVSFFSFSTRLNLVFRGPTDPASKEAVGRVMVEFMRPLLEEHYFPIVQSHYLQELRVEQIQSITDQVEGLMRVQEGTGPPDPQIQMACHYLVCRLRMAQLRSMATMEPSPGRPQEMHEAHMRKLANDSAASGAECVKWAKTLAGNGDRTMLAQVEIVNLLATHYQTTYGKRLVLGSWNTMRAIKNQVLRSAIVDGIPLGEELLGFCDDEWKVLNASTKEWLSRQRPSATEGEDRPPDNEGIAGLRKLSFLKENGIPPATFVKVLDVVRRERPAKKDWPEEWNDIMRTLTTRGGEVRRIEVPGSDYVCLMVGSDRGLLLKTDDDRIDVGPVLMVVEALRREGAAHISICVNFANELVSAEMLRRFKLIAEKHYPDTIFQVVDIVLLTSNLISSLRQHGVQERFELTPEIYL
ncbi:MAG: hypothetical protein GXX95_04785 [Methanomassiliicoccus sp.]|nr:hypothetical protein [Methanomassiliicoccus sp.]